MPLEIAVIAYPQKVGILIEPRSIDGIRYVGLETGEPYAVKLTNNGDRPIRVKLWFGNYPQQRRATSFLRLVAELVTRKDATVWNLQPGDEALHPAGSHFKFTPQMTTVVAKVYDDDGNEIDHTGVVLVWEAVLNNMLKERHQRA